MTNQNQFSCFIIGEGTLPIQCAQILLDRGDEQFFPVVVERVEQSPITSLVSGLSFGYKIF